MFKQLLNLGRSGRTTAASSWGRAARRIQVAGRPSLKHNTTNYNTNNTNHTHANNNTTNDNDDNDNDNALRGDMNTISPAITSKKDRLECPHNKSRVLTF